MFGEALLSSGIRGSRGAAKIADSCRDWKEVKPLGGSPLRRGLYHAVTSVTSANNLPFKGHCGRNFVVYSGGKRSPRPLLIPLNINR